MGNKSGGIKVESVFEVTNGLSGMNRDVILHLCILLGQRLKTVRSIFGISQEYLEWKKHHYFVSFRKESHAVSLYVRSLKPSRGCTIQETRAGPRCSITGSHLRAVFVNRTVKEGVYRWMVQISYEKKKDKTSSFSIGVNPSNSIEQCSEDFLGAESGFACFHFCKFENGKLKSCLYGVRESILDYSSYAPLLIGVRKGGFDYGTVVPDGSFVSIEADCKEHMVAFFVGNKKVPHAFTGVCSPLHFGMSGRTEGTEISFTSISFRRLPSATPSSVVCKMYEV